MPKVNRRRNSSKASSPVAGNQILPKAKGPSATRPVAAAGSQSVQSHSGSQLPIQSQSISPNIEPLGFVNPDGIHSLDDPPRHRIQFTNDLGEPQSLQASSGPIADSTRVDGAQSLGSFPLSVEPTSGSIPIAQAGRGILNTGQIQLPDNSENLRDQAEHGNPNIGGTPQSTNDGNLLYQAGRRNSNTGATHLPANEGYNFGQPSGGGHQAVEERSNTYHGYMVPGTYGSSSISQQMLNRPAPGAYGSSSTPQLLPSQLFHAGLSQDYLGGNDNRIMSRIQGPAHNLSGSVNSRNFGSRAGQPMTDPRDGYVEAPIRTALTAGIHITYVQTPLEALFTGQDPVLNGLVGYDHYQADGRGICAYTTSRVIRRSISHIDQLRMEFEVQPYLLDCVSKKRAVWVPKLDSRKPAKTEYFYKLISSHYVTDGILNIMFGLDETLPGTDGIGFVDRAEYPNLWDRSKYRFDDLHIEECVRAVQVWWQRGFQATGVHVILDLPPEWRTGPYYDAVEMAVKAEEEGDALDLEAGEEEE